MEVDAWEAPPDLHARPILHGAPSAADGDRWFLAAQFADLASGQLDQLLADLEDTRGYQDRHAKGGGLALFMTAAVIGVVVRTFQRLPVPTLHPDHTWLELSRRGLVTGVRVAGPAAVHDWSGLRANLRLLLDPLLAALHQRTGFSLAGQWAQIESGVASALLECDAFDPQDVLAFIDGLVDDDALLRRGKPRIGWVERRGIRRPYATRRVCCFNCLGRSRLYCGRQCPIVPPAQRAADALHELIGNL